MIVKKEPITPDNLFEQMALLVKSKLIDQGLLPTEANDIAIEFVKKRGEDVVKNVINK